MFPNAGPGIALLLLRVCVGTALISGTATPVEAMAPIWCDALLAALLSLGVFTPFIAAACAVLEAARFVSAGSSHLELAVFAGNAVSLVLLGPGAYSLDGRRFGRRVILSRGS